MINLDVDTKADFSKPITVDELKAAVRKPVKKSALSSVKKQNVKSGVRFARDYKTKQAVLLKKCRNKVLEEQERQSLNGKVRKYTREMQNRDAIASKSLKMKKQALSTASDFDDKFAEAVQFVPGRKFDNIIYNSSTAKEASVMLDDIYDDIIDIAEAIDTE